MYDIQCSSICHPDVLVCWYDGLATMMTLEYVRLVRIF